MDLNEKTSGMLSDVDIRQLFGNEIKIYTEYKHGDFAFNLDSQLQLASIDLRFRNECKRFKKGLNGNLCFEMLKNHAYTEPFEISNDEVLVINPGEMIFTTTLETVVISNKYAGIITGRSSFARLGIMVHCCQEFINPGQGSPIALQIVNLGAYPIELDMRIPICQLILFKLNTPASDSYSKKTTSKYKNESSFISSKIYEETTTPHTTKGKPTRKTLLTVILRRYLYPFLPSLIIALFFLPLIQKAEKLSIAELIQTLLSTPVSLLILVTCVIIFIYLRKKDKE